MKRTSGNPDDPFSVADGDLVWPPLPLTESPTSWKRPPREADQDVRDRPEWAATEPARGWIEQIERFWLGRTSEPFLFRAEHQGWTPDEPGEYCTRCGSRVGMYEIGPEGADLGADPGRCGGCTGKRLAWNRFVRLGDYQGLLRRAVHELKFHAWRPVGVELGRLLGAAIARDLDLAGMDRGAVCIVPVAAPFWRSVVRGVSHTEVLANAASAVCGVPVVRGLRKRIRPSQLAVAPSERRTNLRGAFRVRRGRPESVRVVIVLDDVRTTGATMTEACRTLRKGWSEGRRDDLEVWAACVGVAQSRRERLVWTDKDDAAPASRWEAP